jgi:hypothetical protein
VQEGMMCSTVSPSVPQMLLMSLYFPLNKIKSESYKKRFLSGIDKHIFNLKGILKKYIFCNLLVGERTSTINP